MIPGSPHTVYHSSSRSARSYKCANRCTRRAQHSVIAVIDVLRLKPYAAPPHHDMAICMPRHSLKVKTVAPVQKMRLRIKKKTGDSCSTSCAQAKPQATADVFRAHRHTPCDCAPSHSVQRGPFSNVFASFDQIQSHQGI